MGQAMKTDYWKAQRNLKMKIKLSRISVSIMAAVLSPALLAANLQSLDVASLPGDKVELKLSFDEPVTAPRGYTIEQPARIALDLPGVKNKLGTKNRELGSGNARSLSIIEANDRTRMIINLSNLSPYSTRAEGNNVYIVVGEGVSASAPIANTPIVKPYVAQQRGIRDIDFQRGEQGEGNVVIELNDPNNSPDIQEQGGKIRLTFAKSQLPEALRVRLDVKDFATPVQFVNASESNGKVTIVVEPTGFYDYLAYQTDNKLTLSVKPLTQDDMEKRKAALLVTAISQT